MSRYIAKVGKSDHVNKKYRVEIYDLKENKMKTMHIGDSRYEDFTIHKDEKRKENYIKRHSHENFKDMFSKGFWAKWLLWNKPTLKESMKDIENRFRIRVM